jgi:hypothetical protein
MDIRQNLHPLTLEKWIFRTTAYRSRAPGFVDMFLLDHYLVFCVVFFALLVFVLCFVPNVASISR